MTDKFPDGFFVAYKLFTGGSFPPGGTWGGILDGPVTDEAELVDKILEAFKDDYKKILSGTLKVWFCAPGVPVENCTVWAIAVACYELWHRGTQ